MKAIYKKLLLTSCSCLAAACLAIPVFQGSKSALVNADGCEVSPSAPVATVYNLQDTFTLPSAELSYNGQSYAATKKTITFPDGKRYAADSVRLTMAGTYAVEYSREIQGKILSGALTFSVYEDLYSVTGEGATAVYEEELAIHKVAGKSGISVSLPMGGVFTYNEVIDLANMKKNDRLIELYATPTTIGVPEAGNLIVQFTDAYNPENYFTIITYDNIDKPNKAICDSVYQLANAYNQAPTGVMESNSPDTVAYDGGTYSLHKNSYYGYYGLFSFGAYADDPDHGSMQHPFTLSMDYAERRIYGCSPAVSSQGMISDLDAPEFYPTLWEGFTTGEAIMSIYSTNLLSEAFRFAITDVCGADLSGGAVVDEKAPLITVDYEGNDEDEIPYAIVDKPYKVFTATAADDYAPNVKCATAVYYNYRTNQPVNVDITDGSFLPTKTGIYTIVYSAVDGSGNRAVKEIDVEVKAESALQIDFNVLTTDPKIGAAFALNPIVSGNSGIFETSVRARLQSDNSVAYEVEKQGDSYAFRPVYAGKYDLVISVKDYVQNIEKTQEVEIDVSNAYLQIAEPNLPFVFIKGVGYTIAGLQAYDLSSATPKIVDAKIEYAFDDGEYTSASDDKITITATERVRVKYVFGEGSYVKEYVIPVTDVNYTGKLAVYKYFYGADYTGSPYEDGTIYKTSADGAELAFANELLMSEFSFNFKNVTKKFTTQTISFTDAENSEEKLSLAFRTVNSNKTQVTVNGKYTTAFAFDFSKEEVSLRYSVKDNKLYVNDKECALGDFAGFSSRMARMKIKLDGVSGESWFKVYKLNNQAISSDVVDRVGATLYYDSNKENFRKGEDFVLKNIIVADVLRRDTTFEFSMTDPAEQTCKAKDGTSLEMVTDRTKEYTVTLTQYGDYLLSGKYSDGRNVQRFGITVTVMDDGAPVFTITKQEKNVTLGSEVVFDQYTVTDNIDTQVRVNVYVIDTYGKMILLENEKFTAKEKGLHTVIFAAEDSSGNVTIESYTFTVR